MTEHVEVGTAATPKAKREVKTIVMTDGREVEFAGKRRLLKTAEISEDGFDVTIRLDFVNRALAKHPFRP